MKRFLSMVAFVFYYIGEVVRCNIQVAIDVLTPKLRGQPAFLSIDVSGLSGQGVLLLANLITMTPGTLSLDYDEESALLRVHALYADDPEAERAQIEEKLVARIRRLGL